MRKIFTLALLLCCLLSNAQTFTWTGYSPITAAHFDTVFIPVSGLPATIDSSFGISKLSFDVHHGNNLKRPI